MITASYGKPNQLTKFEDILDALKAGYNIRAVFHYKSCQLISDNEIEEKVPDAIGGMDLGTFEYFAPGSIRNKVGFISASKTVLIYHPRYNFVNNYAKVRIYQNGKVRIIAKYLNPQNQEVLMDESFYTPVSSLLEKFNTTLEPEQTGSIIWGAMIGASTVFNNLEMVKNNPVLRDKIVDFIVDGIGKN